jgi:hypothetical protein
MSNVCPLLEMHITCEEKGEVWETVMYGSNTHVMIDALENNGIKVLKMRINLAR